MKQLHCAVSFGFFAVVLIVTMLVLHPAYIAISLLGAAGSLAALTGWHGLRQRIRWVLPLMVLTVFFNAAFQHRGVTALWYLPNGNAVTLESTVFGLCAAGMLAAAVLWCGCMHQVLTSDKLMALTGPLLPSVSLLFSMALRMAPRILRRLRETYDVQKALDTGRDPVTVLRRCIRALSATVSWMLEHAVVTADSMKARGYGVGKRTHFHRERWGADETVFGTALLLLTALTLAGIFSGSGTEIFYPSLQFSPPTAINLAAWCCWALLCALPMLHIGKEALAWRRSASSI